jgi:hypothetical protein
LASFAYFTELTLKDDPSCQLWISNKPGEARKAASKINLQLELLWEDRRDSDRTERLRLYRVITDAR